MKPELIMIGNSEIQEIKNAGYQLFQDAESTSRLADTQTYFILKGLHTFLRSRGIEPGFTVVSNTKRNERDYEAGYE